MAVLTTIDPDPELVEVPVSSISEPPSPDPSAAPDTTCTLPPSPLDALVSPASTLTSPPFPKFPLPTLKAMSPP